MDRNLLCLRSEYDRIRGPVGNSDDCLDTTRRLLKALDSRYSPGIVLPAWGSKRLLILPSFSGGFDEVYFHAFVHSEGAILDPFLAPSPIRRGDYDATLSRNNVGLTFDFAPADRVLSQIIDVSLRHVNGIPQHHI